jgi:TonB-linked SusC/RagA family outer membrane protein
VKGGAGGTVTNGSGEFLLSVPDANARLSFSFVRFLTKEVALDGKTELMVQLQPDVEALEEVVVVGYGTQKKSDLTGSVASVTSAEVNAYPAIDATQAMQGRATGVMVTSSNGEPGAASRIRIRGGTSINASSEPLYVVDGFAGAAPPPPGDIASIEILKDASSTAIYGSRGANGVILITTKQGKAGKVKVELSTSYSMQEVGKKLDLLNGQQFAEYINEQYANDGNATVPYPNPISYGAGTDWQDEIFRTGNLQNYQLSASGGEEKLRFYTSLTYFGQKGIILNSDYKRFSGLANLDFKASDHVRVGTKMLITRTNSDGVRTQETSGGTGGTGVIGAALKFEPTQGIFDEEGNYTLSKVGDPHDNPVAVALERQNNNVNDMFQGNGFAEFAFLRDFNFHTSLGVQVNNSRNGSYVPTTLVEGRNANGIGFISANKYTNLISENYLTFNRQLNQSNGITVLGGYSYQETRGEFWQASNRNFITDGFSYWNLGGGSNYQNSTSAVGEWQLASFYGRVNYNLKERYLLTFTGRYDGSSRFGANNKWAFFPSGAIAWNVAEEPFMDFAQMLSQLKIRASYGVTGNTEIGNYRSFARFSPTLTVINGTPANAVRPTEVANANLSWESTQQTDIGLDIGFFKNRLTFTADYYYKLTEDLLFDINLPLYTGIPNSLQNIGSVENKGWEFAMNTINFDGAFAWNSSLNLSINRNKILSLPNGDIPYGTVPSHILAPASQILREGNVVGAFYGFIYDGVYQVGDDFTTESGKKPGDVKYRDINGRDENNNLTGEADGVVNNDDRIIIGNPHPDFVFGISNDFTYKNFDLSLFFQGSQGNDMLNYTRMELDWLAGKSNATTDALNRWTPTNTNTDVPRASGSNKAEVSSRWVEDGSYVRLKNLVLGYSLPAAMLSKYKINTFRLYVSAQNILTFTDYSGYDPEVSFRDSNTNVGLDYASYPNVKSYTIGLMIGL